MIDLNKVSEGIHYELVLPEDENLQAWDVRILEGQFNETVIRFGNIQVQPETEELHFNFILVSSPDDDLNEDNIELQDFAAMVLTDIIERGIQDGSVVTGSGEENDT